MIELTVALPGRTYPIRVGDGIAGDPAAYADAIGDACLIVTSDTVARHHLDAVTRALGARVRGVHRLPDGEPAKTLAHVEAVCVAASDAGLDRAATLVALGGGAVGDTAGLAAALYLRGVAYVQVPTTLVAQVDSAVGGKTAVNLAGTKNLIGAFHQPALVVADIASLATLPDRELRAGLGEVVKYALLGGDPWIEWLDHALPALAHRDRAVLADAVARCCRMKAAVVAADERDEGPRNRLNLGHTFGHAFEAAYGGALRHGEAVALGCVAAARLSQTLGWLDARDAARVARLVEAAGLPTALPTPVPDPDRLLALMARDKKVVRGAVRLVLLRAPGDAVVTDDYPHAALVQLLRDLTMGR